MKIRDVLIILLPSGGIGAFVVWALIHSDPPVVHSAPSASVAPAVAPTVAPTVAPAGVVGPAWLEGQRTQMAHGARVPCRADCTSVLTTCMESEDPPDDLIKECVTACQHATSEQFYGCMNRDGFCAGLLPCIEGK